ncbi:hypothetical protein QYE76_048740 [Lolium multiflorum]|uniref:DUF8039 domain-containing protein n=1 Tax=Lolium multiflorum TaxID=4521 RepID=A0AAD8WG67_LOLMU|nr:hypothetical protein QYE76_048740 [Lolium multiflorum]
MENYSLLMGDSSVDEDGGVDGEAFRALPRPGGVRNRDSCPPDLGFAMAAAGSHLLRSGFMPSYYCWTKHGERGVMMEDNEEEEEDDDGYPNFPEYDDTAEGNEDNEVEDQEAPDEPADDDLGRAIADARRECETEKERLAFDKMIEDHNKLLYPTCEDGHKKLGSTLELLQWKAENGVTDSGFGKLLTIIKRKLPRGNELPASTYEAKKIVCPLGLDVQKIHACINDCILYRGEYENLDACPVCTALRYKIRRDDPGDVEGERPRKRVPAKPSGSSTSSVKSRKRGPAKKLDDGVRHDITHIAKDGKPIAPEKGAKAFIAQCGVLVRDHVPITVREWNKPKGLVLSAEEEGQGLYIDDVAKNSIMDKLMSHFNIVPEEGGDAEKAKMEQALREFGKKKMAELFKSHKKRLRRLIKIKKTPDNEKVKTHWEEFVKYSTESEEFKRRSEINKANAALKLYHQILGPGGYRANRPKWQAAEEELTRKGIRLGTHGWIERCKEWFYGIGGTLHPETGKCIYKKAHLKVPIDALERAHRDVEAGLFQPERENDELTRALGNKEHGGRTRGTEGSVPWKYGFPAERKRFPDKSHERRKARETDRLANLEEGMSTMKAQLTMVTQVLTSQMAQGQAVDPALLNAIAPLQSQPHRKSSVASSQQVDDDDDDDQVVEPPRYPPVDDLTESRPCELHVKVFNLSFKAAVGILLPTRSYHCRSVQDDFAVVMVDEVMRDYEGLVLEHPAGEDGEIKELGEARRTTVQWRKENIVFPGEKPTSMPPPPPPPPESPPRDDSPVRDDDSPIHDQSAPRENTPPPPPPPRQETPPPPLKQKRKRSAAPPTAPKRSSTPMRAQTPELLPHEQTEEQKAFLAPKKMFIPPQTVKHFAETRMKRPELRADYDRSLGQSSRASKEAKKVAQLGQQDIQAAPHFIVEPYHDPETASMIERAARAQGASVEYEDYYPTAQVVNTYRYGKDLVKPGELARLGTQMRRLHEWYLKACRRSESYLTVYLRDEHYFRGEDEINLELEELFQLFNQDALDKAVISCYCLMKKLEYKRGKLLPLGFIDPNTVHEVTVRQYPKDTEDNIVMFLEKQADKEDIFFPYNFNFHFILLIIDLHLGVVNVMDSKRKEYAEWADMAAILQRAWKRFINTVPGEWKPELTFRDYPGIGAWISRPSYPRRASVSAAKGLLQDRRPLVLPVSRLRLAAVSGSVMLFPSAPAAFVRHAAGPNQDPRAALAPTLLSGGSALPGSFAALDGFRSAPGSCWMGELFAVIGGCTFQRRPDSL